MKIEELLKNNPVNLTISYNDLMEFAKDIVEETLRRKDEFQSKKRIVRGVNGLMEVLQCGRAKASKIISSGIINDAITSNGRLMLIDADKAMELLNNKPRRR